MIDPIFSGSKLVEESQYSEKGSPAVRVRGATEN